MIYRFELTPAAQRQFRKLAPEIKRQLAPIIDSLATEPRAKGAVALSGLPRAYRLRHGDDRLLVLVIRTGHGREVYWGLR